MNITFSALLNLVAVLIPLPSQIEQDSCATMNNNFNNKARLTPSSVLVPIDKQVKVTYISSRLNLCRAKRRAGRTAKKMQWRPAKKSPTAADKRYLRQGCARPATQLGAHISLRAFMDIYAMIEDLRQELKRLDEAITALEGLKAHSVNRQRATKVETKHQEREVLDGEA